MTDSRIPSRISAGVGVPTGVNIPGDESLNKPLLHNIAQQIAQCTDREKAVVWRIIRSQLCAEDLTPEEKANMKEILRGVYPIREVNNAKWPVNPDQRFGSFVFIPAKDAKPNEDGIYGMIRLNHMHSSESRMNEDIQYITEQCDSRWRVVGIPVHRWAVCVSQADAKVWSEKHIKSGNFEDDETDLKRVHQLRNEIASAGQKVFNDARDQYETEEAQRRQELADQMEEIADIGDDDETPEERAERRLRKMDSEPLSTKYVKLRIERASCRYTRETFMTKVRYLDDKIDEYTRQINDMKRQDPSVHENFDQHLERVLSESSSSLDDDLKKLL